MAVSCNAKSNLKRAADAYSVDLMYIRGETYALWKV